MATGMCPLNPSLCPLHPPFIHLVRPPSTTLPFHSPALRSSIAALFRHAQQEFNSTLPQQRAAFVVSHTLHA